MIEFTNLTKKFENKIAVDGNYCVGCGVCANIAPEIFKIINGRVVLVKESFDEKEKENAETAVDNCPVNIIDIIH